MPEGLSSSQSIMHGSKMMPAQFDEDIPVPPDQAVDQEREDLTVSQVVVL